MNRRWTDAERKFILDNCHILKDADIAAKLALLTGKRVSIHAVRRVRATFQVKKARGRGLCEVVSRPLQPRGVGLVVAGG